MDVGGIWKSLSRRWSLFRVQLSRSLALRILTGFICLFVVGVIGVSLWLTFLDRTSANANPFTAQVLASVQFPLYYPTNLPTGFRMDPTSVSKPRADVVIFNLDGPGSQKIYFSEEPKPGKYNIGDFFNSLTGLKEYGVNGGTVAIGRNAQSDAEIANYVNSQVWVLANTNAPIPTDQMTTMMETLILGGQTRN
ncbi:MAG TPA: hypothetical protein VGS28_04215 [Candidatus Saccharimonadales bacterium]|nr:hypothetical protein [Candidatus Saccharimonadales bacterium]